MHATPDFGVTGPFHLRPPTHNEHAIQALRATAQYHSRNPLPSNVPIASSSPHAKNQHPLVFAMLCTSSSIIRPEVLHSPIEITAFICGSKQFFRIDHGVISKMSVTEQLARFAIESGPSILTDEVAASAKLKFLDTIAVMLPGSRHPSGTMHCASRDRWAAIRSRACSSTGRRLRRRSPAISTRVSAHALEYDDYTESVATRACAWCRARSRSPSKLGTSGARMLDAFIVGFEIESCVAKGLRPAVDRPRLASERDRRRDGHRRAAVRGMMDFDQLKLRMAFGLAASAGLAACARTSARCARLFTSATACAAEYSRCCSRRQDSKSIPTSSKASMTKASKVMRASAWRTHSTASASTVCK